ncbi:MAG: hypothetical protein ACI90V_012236, partial [Bacillariaceae sp.]
QNNTKFCRVGKKVKKYSLSLCSLKSHDNNDTATLLDKR